ncbi:MAG: hypothetical protein CL401_01430 [Acidiferrobacteraceae bacterium]|nr:hypothetical protein [Acidiferrobacteraceae bacterium]
MVSRAESVFPDGFRSFSNTLIALARVQAHSFSRSPTIHNRLAEILGSSTSPRRWEIMWSRKKQVVFVLGRPNPEGLTETCLTNRLDAMAVSCEGLHYE